MPLEKQKKNVKCHFWHGPCRNMPVGPAVTRKPGAHADQPCFGLARAETSVFRPGPCRKAGFGPAVADAALFSKFLENARYFLNFCLKKYYFKKNPRHTHPP